MSNVISVCNCGSPLVYTFAFSGAEYYCVECGNTYGMFGTNREDETPELAKRQTANEKKFAKARKGLLSGGAMLRDCDECSKTNRPHLYHATEKEKKAHQAALARLDKLASKS